MLFDDKTDKFLLPITNKIFRIKDHTESKKNKVLQVKCNDKLVVVASETFLFNGISQL